MMIEKHFVVLALLLFALATFDPKSYCQATPTGTATGSLRDISLSTMPEGNLVTNLTRQHDGDLFIAKGMSSCNMDTCVGLSSGTAGLFVSDTRLTDTSGTRQPQQNLQDTASSDFDAMASCECRCLPYLSTYREDLGICVDDIHECALSPFISGSSSEKIPFVFLPLRGQIIHPSREISFPGVRTPVCAVTGSQYLSEKGWSELRNPIDTDFPFRLFRDEGRTFLQWLGEPDLRQKMQGRLILVHLMCRDMSIPSAKETKNLTEAAAVSTQNIFTPCVAFRVNGNPVKYVNNVSEVLFQSETTANLAKTSEGLTTREYVVIGVCSLLLGLIYVASVFLYLHVKKRKSQLSDGLGSIEGPKNDGTYPKNDQVTFGTSFSRSGSAYGSTNIMDPHRSTSRSRRNSLSGSTGNLNGEEIGIVKSNPLLKHYPNLSDHSGFISDLSNSNSECEENHSSLTEKLKNMQTSALVHPSNDGGQTESDYHRSLSSSVLEPPPSPTQENECLPEENVSIIEEMGSDEKLENMRAIVNGTVRKKLYFNPAYFEPHLLMSPPPAAIEFLQKIREVIAIAKYKMATKRFQPSLIMIPEEYHANQSERNSNCSRNHNEKNGCPNSKNCSGCPGCAGENHANGSAKCNNCGDKRNSIQKWLEGVPTHNTGKSNEKENKSQSKGSVASTENAIVAKGEKSPKEALRPNKAKPPSSGPQTPKKRPPPPLPPTAPKIISHSLKPHVPRNVIIDNGKPAKSPSPPKVVESPATQNKSDTTEIYNHLTKNGSEIYNNPKFNLHDSPPLSHRSKSSSHKSRSSRKRIEVLDQYANPSKSEKSHYEMLKSIKHMPDMVYEALAKDYSFRNFSSSERSTKSQYNIPIPDYETSSNKNLKDIYNCSTQGSDPYVPTPDYSTLEKKKSLRQYQPDSPIYRRKSPQYLIVDYETDSLERSSTANKKNLNSLSPSSSNNSSDASSQPSPSLSTALPMEEEVEVHHTVYDKVEGFRKDGDVKIKKNVAAPRKYEDLQAGVNAARIKYNTPFQGSMTIEVDHDPGTDISTDSDQFEPDTLDRKPKKQNLSISKSSNAWSEHLRKSNSFVNGSDNYSSLENMTSLPDFNQKQIYNDQLVLRSSNSFRSTTGSCGTPTGLIENQKEEVVKPSFGSLREIYQSTKFQKQLDRPKLTNLDFEEQGRLLTLEAKHTKRQRKNVVDQSGAKIMPPDVIPAGNEYYDTPKSQIKGTVNGSIDRKNLPGWNGDDFSRTSKNKPHVGKKSNTSEDTDVCESTSSNSESTEITGVSDTQATSELEPDMKSSRNHKNGKSSFKDYVAMRKTVSTPLPSNQHHNRSSSAINSLNPEIDRYSETYEHMSPRSNFNIRRQSYLEDIDKIEVLSSRSLSNRSIYNATIDQGKKAILNDLNSGVTCAHMLPPDKNCLNVQKVYRVEVNHSTNGMQIAMGLRDQAKKSKDLKNAWRKFVSMATSKFNGNNNTGSDNKMKDGFDPYDKKSTLSDGLDRDEGISSLIDDGRKIFDVSLLSNGGGSLDNQKRSTSNIRNGVGRSNSSYFDHRYGARQDQDSGYISGDSSESKAYTRRVYERYNFKAMTDRDQIMGIETIEDNSDVVEETSVKSFSTKNYSGPGPNIECNNRSKRKSQDNSSRENFNLGVDNPIQVNVYSSEEEPYSSPCPSSESDDEGNTDLCESGAESIETHSVLYKNIRNSQRSKYSS